MVTEGKPSRSRADVARFNPSVELPEEEEGERREGWNTSGVNSLSAEAAANSPEVPRITAGRAVCQRAWQLQHVCPI